MDARSIGSQSELASKAGIDRSVISQWLNDKAQPTIPLLRKLEAPLGRPLIELMVAAGLISKEDARLKELPKPPKPVKVDVVEEEIRGAGLPPDMEKALLEAREANRAAIRAQINAMRAAGLLNETGPRVNSA